MITAKQYDVLLNKLMCIENRMELILNNQIEIVTTLKQLNNKTIVISDVNKQIEQIQKDIKSLQDEGAM